MRGRRLDVAHDGEDCPVRTMEALEEPRHLRQPDRVQIGGRATREAGDLDPVGMTFRVEQLGGQRQAVRHRVVAAALAPLVADHLALHRDPALVGVAQHVGHAIALEPQAHRPSVGRELLVDDGAVQAGEAPLIGRPELLEDLEVAVLGNVSRPLEQEVLDHVGEPLVAGRIIALAHVVGDGDADAGGATILLHRHDQAVAQAPDRRCARPSAPRRQQRGRRCGQQGAPADHPVNPSAPPKASPRERWVVVRTARDRQAAGHDPTPA